MLVYDFEVVKHDWLVVVLDLLNKTEHTIVNNRDELINLYEKHKSSIWVGFNSRHYDQFIFKAIICGLNPKECNDHIIKNHQSGYTFSKLFNKIPLNNYDVMESGDGGLKKFEGFMGNNIKESSISFDIDRKLTNEELNELATYCRHDVHQTAEILLERISDFEAQMELLKMYKMPLSYISKTKVQLSAEILGATKRTYDDEFDIHIPDCARVEKYTQVVDWYTNPKNHRYKVGNKTNQLELIMAGIPMKFGYGGVHGALTKYHAKGFFLNMDVGSLYPTLMALFAEYCFSRSVTKEGRDRYIGILHHRLKLKAEGKKKEQAPFKIVLNGTYGAMKDKYNKLYDPRGANNTCIFGQILVGVDLLERLEGKCEIIQVNTDGILIRMFNYDDYAMIDDIAYEWEQRTGLTLEFDDYGYGEIFQKDVNNYLIIDEWGNYKAKGEYVKKLNRLDYDLPIVNKALVDYMVKGVPIERTINSCNDLKEFQTVKKISSKYDSILHGGCWSSVQRINPATGRLKMFREFTGERKLLNEKCVRAFASIDKNDGGLWKTKGNKIEKIESTPEHVFIYNGDVNDVKVPKKLDKSWYIGVAKDRLHKFGVAYE